MAREATPHSVTELLEALGIEDAGIRGLVAYNLRQREQAGAASQRAAHEWRARAERSERLIDALLGKLEALACGLGACPSCWGDDADCKECGGVGRCGAFLPDRRCFELYVVPVLERVRNARQRERQTDPVAKTRASPMHLDIPREETPENEQE
jgi:hypothetical protein